MECVLRPYSPPEQGDASPDGEEKEDGEWDKKSEKVGGGRRREEEGGGGGRTGRD